MLKLKCAKCQSEAFQINRRRSNEAGFPMVRCCSCGQRYCFSGVKWYEFQMPKKALVKEVVQDVCHKAKKVFTEAPETVGQWIKRQGVERKKRKDLPVKKKSEVPKQVSDMAEKTIHRRAMLEHRWADEISLLRTYGNVIFTCKFHKGKLRGRDAAKIFHRDLKILGFKTRLIFSKNRSAKVCWENRT